LFGPQKYEKNSRRVPEESLADDYSVNITNASFLLGEFKNNRIKSFGFRTDEGLIGVL
jgi:hypothetical protein